MAKMIEPTSWTFRPCGVMVVLGLAFNLQSAEHYSVVRPHEMDCGRYLLTGERVSSRLLELYMGTEGPGRKSRSAYQVELVPGEEALEVAPREAGMVVSVHGRLIKRPSRGEIPRFQVDSIDVPSSDLAQHHPVVRLTDAKCLDAP